MAKKTFLAIVCVVLSVHATAWGQGPGYALQGPYGPPAGPWAGGPGVMQAAYQQGPMQAGPMMPGGPMMQPGPMPQPAEAVAAGDPCCACNQTIPNWEFFGDFLYIRPRDANVAYGVIFDATKQPDTPPSGILGSVPLVEIGQPGVASIDFHPGFRVGGAKAFDECNAVVATYTHYEGEDQNSLSTDQLNAPPGADSFEIRSLVSHPATWSSNAASDYLEAASDYYLRYDLVDVDFRWTFENQNDTRLSLLGGMRYALLDQRLDVQFTSTDVQNVHSQINFDGGGLRFGIEGERRTPFGLVFYGRAVTSVVAGTFRGAYTQTNQINTNINVDTGYPADRVVPIVDLEVGTGWSFCNDKLWVTAGYSFSGWFNVVRTDSFISAVQSNNFSGMSNTLTFDGFVGRIELQF